jgi:PKD repeat protein
MGLRNPFRFTLHPLTNEPYIGDVGWSTWEEINTGKGANFGWPCYEGGAAGSPAPVESGVTTSRQQGGYETNAATTAQCQALYQQGLGAVRAPIFSYNHAGTDGAGGTGGASANGGAFYTGTVYPPVYQNALFILDYNRRWIRYLTFDAQGKATVQNFGRENANGMVQVLTGPDSNLYVVVLSPTGSEIRRIRYIAGGNTPPTAVASATPTVGAVPLTVAFSSLGSFDPDAQPLSYGWAFGDGATSTAPNPTHLYDAPGVYTATLTVTELTTPFAPRTDDVVITVGNDPPLATITAPLDGTHYNIGDVIPYAGSGTSGAEPPEPVDPSQLTWNLRLHHNEHLHFSALPGTPNEENTESTGSLTIIEHGDNTYYELCLTVTIPPSLTDTRCVTLLPNTTPITLTTTPPGLLINYEDEGLTQASPFLINPVVGSSQTTSLPLIQGGVTFDRWSDGVLSNSHPFVVGTTPTTYTAEHLNQPPVAVASATPLSGNAPLTVAFNGSGSSDPEFATLTHSWNFGDGTAGSTQANPVHEYTSSGTYPALLTVTDQRGGSSSQTQSIVVGPVSPLCGNGQVDAGEACDGGGCCTAGCQIAPAATVCRAATGTCDVAETCSGIAASCPADAFAAEETTCSVGAVCHSGVCEAATSPPVTAWPDTTVPGFTAAGDASVELGVKFRSDVAGYVTSIRFYKFAANTGTHVGNLWSISGALLATATFTNETASGWQRVDFSQPVAIDADTTYVASYHCPNGFYAFGFGYFATQGVDVPPLHLLANDVPGGNGVFHYAATSSFPANTYNASNYWVDVVFSAATVAACSDTLDQDGDGFAGFPQDPGCATAADIDERSPALPCDNGIDDDGDGYVDFGVPAGSGLLPDPGCRNPSSTLEDPQCQDGLDNDQMSGLDFDGGASLHDGIPISTADPQCTKAYRTSEQASISCGLGTELAFVLPLLGALSRRMRKLAS